MQSLQQHHRPTRQDLRRLHTGWRPRPKHDSSAGSLQYTPLMSGSLSPEKVCISCFFQYKTMEGSFEEIARDYCPNWMTAVEVVHRYFHERRSSLPHSDSGR